MTFLAKRNNEHMINQNKISTETQIQRISHSFSSVGLSKRERGRERVRERERERQRERERDRETVGVTQTTHPGDQKLVVRP